jgi:CBS domain-containing protein
VQVKDVMIPVVGHVEPDMNLRDAAERMKALNMDPMPVVDGGKVVGVLGEQRLVELAAADGLAMGSHRVREAMTSDVPCCSADEDVESALRHFVAGTTARIPVVDGDQHLVGLVSLADLQKRALAEAGGVAAVSDVESVSELVQFDDDRVDFMSDSSFPASDPIPPPTSLGARGERDG